MYSFFIAMCYLLGFVSTALAQDESTESSGPWDHSLAGSVALSQVAFKDWAQGGESSMAWTLIFDGKHERNDEKTNWRASYKSALGQTRQGDSGFRKTDDKIDVETVLTYKLGPYINPFVSATLKTQFARGLDFDDLGNSTPVSQFFDPAYLTQTVGAGYEPIDEIKTRLAIGVRETITRTYNTFSDDPSTANIEKIKTEGGYESVTIITWALAENILFNGKFETFIPLNNVNDPILRSDTTLTLKVNKYITTNINVQVVRDLLASPETQIKQALSVGLSYSIF